MIDRGLEGIGSTAVNPAVLRWQGPAHLHKPAQAVTHPARVTDLVSACTRLLGTIEKSALKVSELTKSHSDPWIELCQPLPGISALPKAFSTNKDELNCFPCRHVRLDA